MFNKNQKNPRTLFKLFEKRIPLHLGFMGGGPRKESRGKGRQEVPGVQVRNQVTAGFENFSPSKKTQSKQAKKAGTMHLGSLLRRKISPQRVTGKGRKDSSKSMKSSLEDQPSVVTLAKELVPQNKSFGKNIT